MKSLVQHGIGHTILPWHAVSAEVARGELRATPIVEPSIDRTIYMAQASDRPLSPAASATIQIITDCLQTLTIAPDGPALQ